MERSNGADRALLNLDATYQPVSGHGLVLRVVRRKNTYYFQARYDGAYSHPDRDRVHHLFEELNYLPNPVSAQLGDIMANPNHEPTKCVPSLEEQQFLEDRIYEFNRDQTGQDDGQIFAFFVRGDKQEILGGVSGWTWARACEIRTLWVHPAWRGQGQGRALLQAAEQEAVARGCEVILLTSYSFQAPEFYQKCGFELAWQLNDFPPGHRHCCMVKRLEGTNCAVR